MNESFNYPQDDDHDKKESAARRLLRKIRLWGRIVEIFNEGPEVKEEIFNFLDNQEEDFIKNGLHKTTDFSFDSEEYGDDDISDEGEDDDRDNFSDW
ncbi:MAG TPA: hypothetical protein VHA74_03250 [Candidatus Dojkabacteria bacterium]|nr:hypothetical protein [Candidatus Dojkabacteria bacterium]